MPNKITDDTLSIFIEECNEILERLTLSALDMEKGNHAETIIHGFYRDIHTLKGSAALYGFQTLSRLAHAMESRFELLRKSQIELTPLETDLLLQCIDTLGQILRAIQANLDENFDGLVAELEQKLAQNHSCLSENNKK